MHATELIDKTGDGAIRATERGRTGLAEMYEVGADVTGELWADQEGSLAGLNNLAGRLIHAALATGAVDAGRRGYPG